MLISPRCGLGRCCKFILSDSYSVGQRISRKVEMTNSVTPTKLVHGMRLLVPYCQATRPFLQTYAFTLLFGLVHSTDGYTKLWSEVGREKGVFPHWHWFFPPYFTPWQLASKSRHNSLWLQLHSHRYLKYKPKSAQRRKDSLGSMV
jgi:hypothetical protein